MYELCDPIVRPYVPRAHLAPRLDSIANKQIGLWSNRKINTAELLDEIEAILREEHGVNRTRRGFYNAGRVMREGEWGDIDGCDAVILTHGD